jgi:hypothetical protein
VTRIRDLEQIGRNYRKVHHGFVPDRLYTSGSKTRRLTLKALDDGTGWICRLSQAGPQLQHGVLHLKQLGLEHLESEDTLWNRKAVDEIKQAVKQIAPGMFWARLEVGKEARHVHVHILTHESFGLHCALEPVRGLERMAGYLAKAPAPNDDLGIGQFIEAKCEAKRNGKNLPRLSFWRGIPK